MRRWVWPSLVLVLASAMWIAPAEAQDEFGGDEFGGDEFGGDEFGGDESGGDESGSDESGSDESGGDESGSDESGGDESGSDESGGDEFGGDEFGGDESGSDEPAPSPAPADDDATPGDAPPSRTAPAPQPSSDRETRGDRPDTEATRAQAPPEAPEAEGRTKTRTVVEEQPGPADEDEAHRARLFRRQNTIGGSVGGIHVLDAGSGPAGTFRVQLASEFFLANEFLRENDDHDHVGGTLSLSWSVLDFLELFASISAYANSNSFGDPVLLQVLGDTTLGVKGFYELTPWLTLGGDASMSLLNTVGDIGVVFQSTSFGFRGNATADLQGLDNPLPLIFRMNLQYWFDNSEALVEDVEDARYLRIPDRRSREDEFRHLVLPEERFGLQINRTDFFNIALGVEAPFEVTSDMYLNPIVEWTWNIPVNRKGYSCLIPPSEERAGGPRFGQDGCLDEVGAKAFHQVLTLGLRVLPPVKGLGLFVGADIGLTGTGINDFVRELAPNAPYNIHMAASYAYDTRPEIKTVVEEVEREVEVAEAPPVQGRVHGEVVESGTEAAVSDAVVAFPGKALNAIVSDEDGAFRTYLFDPGEVVEMAITHPDYESGTCSATLPEEPPDEEELVVEVRCELEGQPKEGDVRGVVTSVEGDPIEGAELQVAGPAKHDLTTDEEGRFRLEGVSPGSYTALVQHEDYLVKLEQFEVEPRETDEVEVALVPRPKRSMVRVKQRQIVIRRQINFATNSAEILEASEPILQEVADVLIRNPHLKRIEVQGHTDNRGPEDHNMELSQDRAESVLQWLVDQGVPSERLEAKGYGETKPVVPNITAANRARNRRVQFMIKERTEPEE